MKTVHTPHICYGNCTKAGRKRLQKLIKSRKDCFAAASAEKNDIAKHYSHPGFALFHLLPSGKHTIRLKNCLFPRAVSTLNCLMQLTSITVASNVFFKYFYNVVISIVFLSALHLEMNSSLNLVRCCRQGKASLFVPHISRQFRGHFQSIIESETNY